jgi:tetratricopeptide (TPR) repeat protein
MEYMYDGNHAAAVVAWDDIVRQWPEYGPGYYWRAYSYRWMTANQQSQYEYEEYLRLALQDIDRAIALSELPSGDYYSLRSEIYEAIAADTEPRTMYEALQDLSYENLARAVMLGTGDPVAYRGIPGSLVGAGRCQEALTEAKRQLRAIEPSDSPSARVNQSVSEAYTCLGYYSPALDYSARGLAIWDAWDFRLHRTVILYGLGRNNEALEILNAMIEESPSFSGYRYFYRALLEYNMGRPDLAEQDLEVGYRNTWVRDKEAALVRGLLARDSGDREYAIAQLQLAEQTIRAINRPFLDRARRELAKLGAMPSEPQPEPDLDATPMPTLAPLPEGSAFYATPAAIDVSYTHGTRRISLSPEGYLTYRFSDPLSATVTGVDWLMVSVSPSAGTPFQDLKIYLWKPKDNLWIMYSYEGPLFEIPNPGRFVLPNGDVFVAAYTAGGAVSLERIEVSAGLRLADASQVTVGTRPTQQP